MDYTERLDQLIEQFAGETGGLLARISEVGDGIEYIEEDIDSVIKALMEYERSVEQSSKKIAAAGEVFVELQRAIGKLAADVRTIGGEQRRQADEIMKVPQSLGAVTESVVQMNQSVHEGNDKSASDHAEIKETGRDIAAEQKLIRSKVDRIGSGVEAIGDALKDVQALFGKHTELQASIKSLQEMLGGITERCDGLRADYHLLSERIDGMASEMKASKLAAEENDRQTHELLEKVLAKMNDLESRMPVRKRSLFR